MSAKLSAARVAEMWEAYRAKPSVNNIVKTCGVSPTTAKKYVEVGVKPYPPFQDRLAAILAAESDLEIDTARQIKARQLKLIDKALKKFEDRLDGVESEKKITIGVDHAVTLMELALVLKGEASTITETRTNEDPIDKELTEIFRREYRGRPGALGNSKRPTKGTNTK